MCGTHANYHSQGSSSCHLSAAPRCVTERTCVPRSPWSRARKKRVSIRPSCTATKNILRRMSRVYSQTSTNLPRHRSVDVAARANLVSGCPARIRSFPRVWSEAAAFRQTSRDFTRPGNCFLSAFVEDRAKCQLIFIGRAQRRVAHNAAYRFTELRRRWKCHATLYGRIERHRFSRERALKCSIKAFNL